MLPWICRPDSSPRANNDEDEVDFTQRLHAACRAGSDEHEVDFGRGLNAEQDISSVVLHTPEVVQNGRRSGPSSQASSFTALHTIQSARCCQSDCALDHCNAGDDENEEDFSRSPYEAQNSCLDPPSTPRTLQLMTESSALCHPECLPEKCRADDCGIGEREDDEDFLHNLCAEPPLTPQARHPSSPYSTEGSAQGTSTFEPHAPAAARFSLPWSSLDGKHEETRLTSDLLPFAKGSSVSNFSSLYRPIFFTGIPTKAHMYKPDPSDYIDVEVHRALQQLSTEAASLLALRRVEQGKYEIEGTNVQVYGAPEGLLVYENDVRGPGVAFMPLQDYINLAANVALDLQRLAFGSFLEQQLASGSEDEDRYRAMQLACMQAKIRQREGQKQVSIFESRCRGAALPNDVFNPSALPSDVFNGPASWKV